MKKYQKHIALTLIASSSFALAPSNPTMADFDIDSLAAILASLDSKYQLDTLLIAAHTLIGLPASEIKGIDILPPAQFIDASDPNYIKLKTLLEDNGNFGNLGGLDEIEAFVKELQKLHDSVDALPKNTPGKAQDYFDELLKLVTLIHVANTHLNLGAPAPRINFQGAEFGEYTGPSYNPDDLFLKGAYKLVQFMDSSSAANYPIPDLTWPNGKKPDKY